MFGATLMNRRIRHREGWEGTILAAWPNTAGQVMVLVEREEGWMVESLLTPFFTLVPDRPVNNPPPEVDQAFGIGPLRDLPDPAEDEEQLDPAAVGAEAAGDPEWEQARKSRKGKRQG